ncbi:MAG TPA: PTS sugar transporter subunit IIB [Psychromonas hadalis]|nr:PTS sugar transporter subunit IIB [Psychromonas hadalis]
MKNILVVCGNGLGTSLMMEIAVKGVVEKLNLEAQVTHTDLSSAASRTADIYVCAIDLAPHLEAQGKTNIISLTNIFDKVAIEEQLKAFI